MIDEIDRASATRTRSRRRALRPQREGVLVGISAGADDQAALEVAARPEMAGKRVVTIVCDSRRALHVPTLLRIAMSFDVLGLGTLRRVLARGRAPTSPRRAIATRRRGASRRFEILTSWAGVQALLAHRVAHALLRGRGAARAAGDRLREPRGHRGRDPSGGEDRRRVLHRPRLRRGDRRDRRDRRPGDALPGGDPGRHRLPARQAPPDARRRRHDRLRRQAARPDRGRRRRQGRRQHGRRRGRARRTRPWSATPATRCGSRAGGSRARTPTGSTCPDPIAEAIKALSERIAELERRLAELDGEAGATARGRASCEPSTGRSSAGG